jgi:histidinol-phosphate aminotransferase
MAPETRSSRREFIGKIGAGAAALALPPVFTPNRLFGAAPRPGTDTVVHINFNESPYGPSEKAVKAIRDAAVGMYGRYFEDDSYEELSKTLAVHHNLKRENIQVAVGSTEILKICDDVFLGDKARLVVAEPAYEAVIQYAVNSKANAAKVGLTSDFRHDLSKMADATTRETGMVYVCNPNNPTGTIVRKDEVQRFMDRIPDSVTVIVDEAYSHFVTDPNYESAVRYVREGRNVIVAKTFSKIYGLAGMRIGYAIARKDLIDRIKPFTVDYSITGLAVNAVIASIGDTQHVERVSKLNATQRQIFFDEMKKANFESTPSQANFVMVNIKTPVSKIIPEFQKRKILVGREFPAMPTFLRVTIGNEDEMKRFYSAFHEIFRG